MKSLSWFLLPLLVFGLGIIVQGQIKGPGDLTLTKMQRRLRLEKRNDDQSELLHLRIRGYSRADVLDLLKRVGADGQKLYKRILRWDLAFPVFYGAAFIIALLNLRTLAESHLSTVVCWLSVTVMMIADWTENWLLLAAIDQFQEGSTLEIVPIKIASVATQTKLYSFGVSLALLVYFFAWAVYRNWKT